MLPLERAVVHGNVTHKIESDQKREIDMRVFSGVKAVIVACTFASLSSLGCNTFRGAGQDIQAGGRGIENAANGARHDKNAGHRHTITATAEPNGSISHLGSTSVRYGSDRTYKIAAYNGHHITDVMVDGRSMGAVNRYRFDNVRTNHTISVLFDKNPLR